MSAIVVYESLYGNTRDIAGAIAEGLRTRFDVDLVEVSQASSDLSDAEFVVVGGPTHVHGMMSERSRAAADHEDGEEHVSTGPLLREWLADLGPGRGVPAAAFDTRLDKPEWLAGAASKGISKRLRKAGFRVTLDRGSFIVDDGEGPLRDGELDRAREWAARLAAAFEEAPA